MLYTLVTSAIGGLQMYDIPALFNVPETGLVGLPDDGKIVTTEAKAKEIRKIAEGLVAMAVREK